MKKSYSKLAKTRFEVQYSFNDQVMSVKDLISKSNRNRAFTYDIDLTHKLSPVAAQHRYDGVLSNFFDCESTCAYYVLFCTSN